MVQRIRDMINRIIGKPEPLTQEQCEIENKVQELQQKRRQLSWAETRMKFLTEQGHNHDTE